MEYHEAAAALQSLQRHRPKLGVDTTQRMLSHLGDPQEGVDFVQIAGSNGKGSTTRMLERVLQAAGLAVGSFTSPALTDFREQVQVNGRPVGKPEVTAFVEEIQPCLDRLRAEDDMPTHFEVLTALAITVMGRSDVDVGILEVGIGGRYDATSAIEPVASAVTSVSLEHTDLLGETVAEIARDKAQVAPADAPLVTGATGPALAAIREETDVITVGPEGTDVRAVEEGMNGAVESEVAIEGPDWALETNLTLLGQHQATNAGVAATLARQVAALETETIAGGLRQATWPGRFEIVGRYPLVVLDGAHNPGAMATLADLVERYEYEHLHVVFAAMRDKDHDRMVARLPSVETAIATRPEIDRAVPPADLAPVLASRATSVEQLPSVPEATERAIEVAEPTDVVLVTGSLFAVAEARDRWIRPVVPKGRERGSASEAVFSMAAFPGEDVDAIGSRVFAMILRENQAHRVQACVADAGGRCVRSTAGAPGGLVATVVEGTRRDLEALASALRSEGLGLRRVGRQLADHLAQERGARAAGGGSIERGGETAIMGVLNVTPDSFHDGGEFQAHDEAIERAREMADAGAAIVDVGGESTRPGADPVAAAEERDRVLPVIEALDALDARVSVDTRKASVAEAALEAGADIVNDVSGLADPEMRFVIAEHDATLVLMHSLSAPVEPGETGRYDDVVDDVRRDLAEVLLHAERAGIDREQIVLDPGVGFGKTPADSFALLDRVDEFHALGCPVLVGHSHKSMFERVDCGPGERLAPTLAATALAAERGADVVRVHDVAANAAALRTVDAFADDA